MEEKSGILTGELIWVWMVASAPTMRATAGGTSGSLDGSGVNSRKGPYSAAT